MRSIVHSVFHPLLVRWPCHTRYPSVPSRVQTAFNSTSPLDVVYRSGKTIPSGAYSTRPTVRSPSLFQYQKESRFAIGSYR